MKLQNLNIVKRIIQYEKNLIESLNKSGFSNKAESGPFDISFLDQCFKLMGIPNEYNLNYLKSWDNLVDNYTAMVFRDISINKGLSNIQKLVEKETLDEYFPRDNKNIILDFLNQASKLQASLKALKINQDSPLSMNSLNKSSFINFDIEVSLNLLGLKDFNDNHIEKLHKVIYNQKNPKSVIKEFLK